MFPPNCFLLQRKYNALSGLSRNPFDEKVRIVLLDEHSLRGRTAIVTGSGRNIGRAIAVLFARAGARVVVNGHRDRATVEAVVAEIKDAGGSAIGVMADVGDPGAIERMVNECVDAFGSVDIAVSNVAIRRSQNFLDISVDDWTSILNTNLNAAFYMARAVLPRMKRRGWGRIIHISGTDGFNAHSTDRAHNTVAKAGVHTLARVLSREFAPFSITVNTVAPGRTDTERDWSNLPADYVARVTRLIPTGRLADVNEIATACLFLASGAGAFITGQVLHVNGGKSTFSS